MNTLSRILPFSSWYSTCEKTLFDGIVYGKLDNPLSNKIEDVSLRYLHRPMAPTVKKFSAQLLQGLPYILSHVVLPLPVALCADVACYALQQTLCQKTADIRSFLTTLTSSRSGNYQPFYCLFQRTSGFYNQKESVLRLYSYENNEYVYREYILPQNTNSPCVVGNNTFSSKNDLCQYLSDHFSSFEEYLEDQKILIENTQSLLNRKEFLDTIASLPQVLQQYFYSTAEDISTWCFRRTESGLCVVTYSRGQEVEHPLEISKDGFKIGLSSFSSLDAFVQGLTKTYGHAYSRFAEAHQKTIEMARSIEKEHLSPFYTSHFDLENPQHRSELLRDGLMYKKENNTAAAVACKDPNHPSRYWFLVADIDTHFLTPENTKSPEVEDLQQCEILVEMDQQTLMPHIKIRRPRKEWLLLEKPEDLHLQLNSKGMQPAECVTKGFFQHHRIKEKIASTVNHLSSWIQDQSDLPSEELLEDDLSSIYSLPKECRQRYVHDLKHDPARALHNIIARIESHPDEYTNVCLYQLSQLLQHQGASDITTPQEYAATANTLNTLLSFETKSSRRVSDSNLKIIFYISDLIAQRKKSEEEQGAAPSDTSIGTNAARLFLRFLKKFHVDSNTVCTPFFLQQFEMMKT